MTDGPFFDDLTVGQAFRDAPSVTLTEGMAAVHQSIVGDRLRLPLDTCLCREVAGRGPLAHPSLVWNIAIGQSTLVTRNVKANLFYRGLAFHRAPTLGDTLRTVTTVVALKQNSPKPGLPQTGLAALRIRTVDQDDRLVLDFHRCAMIPLRNPDGRTEHADDLSRIGGHCSTSTMFDGWDMTSFPRVELSPGLVGSTWSVPGGDVVTSAPELARLTLNIAAVHHDAKAAGGRRLVYGGHTIAVALSQVSRELPQIVWIPAWYSCDHTGPVFEGDTLRTKLTVEDLRTGDDMHFLDLRAVVTADAGEPRQVLDWRFVAAIAVRPTGPRS